MSQPNDAEIVERARKQWEAPGELEIGNPVDARGMVSRVSDPPGAWVRAWVWVDLDEETQP
ncbi:MAG: hypothetical protein EOM21_13095 [Gammaproteobacteria bacterium]|nr:hypothetical protein [Gammaproteobacteria bacterium]